MIRERAVYSIRNTVYQQIVQDEQRQNYQGVIEGSEKFLTNTPLSGKDKRNEEVIQLYSEALVRWVAQQEKSQNQNVQIHLDRYKELIKDSKQGGNQ